MKKYIILLLFIFVNMSVFSNSIGEYVESKDLKEYKNIFLFTVPKEKKFDKNDVNKKDKTDTKETKDEVKEKEVKKREQIIIKALIIDTSSNLFEKLGFNWETIENSEDVNQTGIIGKFLNGEVTFSKIFKNGGNFLGVDFNFLRENGDIKIEAMPTLMIMEGEVGELRVTEEVLIGEKKVTKNDVEHSEPVFSEAGIVFKIEGEVQNEDGEKKILLKIDTEISNFKLTSNYSEKAGAKQKNQTKTVILIPNGSSAFIGGLKQNVDKGTVRKVPFLGDIPLIGNLFKYNRNNRENRDIYIEIEASIK